MVSFPSEARYFLSELVFLTSPNCCEKLSKLALSKILSEMRLSDRFKPEDVSEFVNFAIDADVPDEAMDVFVLDPNDMILLYVGG